MKRIASKHASLSEKITAIVSFVLFLIIALISVYPLFWALINSMKTLDAYLLSNISLPDKWHFDNYVNVFTEMFKIKGS